MKDDHAPAIAWVKSSASSDQGQCVELANGGRVRDSKLGEDSPVLTVTPLQLAAFIAGVRDGQLG